MIDPGAPVTPGSASGAGAPAGTPAPRVTAGEDPAVADGEDPLLADARRVLTDWEPPSAAQDVLRTSYLGFLEVHPDAASRDLRAGHLTASTVVLDDARERILLTLHPLAGRWFQLGGHVEAGDASMAAAALREATEESGIVGLALVPTPISLDWHPTRCRDSARVLGPSSHLDLEYVAVAPPRAEHLRSDESLDLAWFEPRHAPGRRRRRRPVTHPAGAGPGYGLTTRIRRVRDLGMA